MGGENETELPTRAKSGGITVGSLRAHTSKNMVHFHDDATNMRFAYEGVRRFQVGLDSFLRDQQYQFAVGDVCIVRGQTTDAGGRKPADLVFLKTETGWNIILSPCGETVEAYQICDPILAALDEFVQRI